MTHRTKHHDKKGTLYGTSAFLYLNHGADGRKLLDPFFLPAISGERVKGRKFVDIGCGRGFWTIHAAREGAEEVCGFDYQQGMIDASIEALAAVNDPSISNAVRFFVGDANNVTALESDMFHVAASINVGCNLPSLGKHFSEMHRLLVKGGKAVVTLPNSLDVVFTTAQTETERKAIIASLEKRLLTTTVDGIHELDGFPGILRATVFEDNGKLRLLKEGETLQSGTAIFRIIPGLVVPNRYHLLQHYENAAESAGLFCLEINRPRFNFEGDWQEYNKANKDKPIGHEYLDHAAFCVMHLEKAA
jgi:SAM-dependent methyltransferase